MDDNVLQQLVMDELEFEPSIDAANIGVAVDSGVVSLTGHVKSYVEKVAAEHATQRVKGVRAIAQEIQVRHPADKKTSDDEIAKRAANILAWDARVPDGAIWIKVQNGWVTLTGAVKWQYQRMAAESDILKLSGVDGISNQIELEPQVSRPEVRNEILKALTRNAEIETGSIEISVNGDEVTLEGRVHDWYERVVIERAAWSAPGVRHVHDQMTLS